MMVHDMVSCAWNGNTEFCKLYFEERKNNEFLMGCIRRCSWCNGEVLIGFVAGIASTRGDISQNSVMFWKTGV